MHPALMTPSGIPRSGLVCWHDLYDPTASLASVPDLSGNGYSLQLGSTAGEDSNDPAWATGGKGLVFTTDDYCLTGNLSGVAMAGPWTAIVCGNFPGAADDATIWGMGSAKSSTAHTALQQKTGSVAKCQTNGGITTVGSDDDVALNTDGYSIYTLVAVPGGSIVGTRLDTRDTATVASQSPTATPRIALGALPRTSMVTILDAGTMLGHLFYNRALSDAEIQRIYRVLKAMWAARGVTIL